MREADDEAILRSRVYVDTRAGACSEAGDIVQPLASGVISETDIVAELAQLCRGEAEGRGGPQEVTLFKSVGASLEDLAAAILAYRELQKSASP
jgi:ornithine cyclodeaminase